METIRLQTWKILHTYESDMENALESPDWREQHIPITIERGKGDYIWLLADFEMDINDVCSRWWIELEASLDIEAHWWVNGKPYLPGMLTMCDVTNDVAIGENQLVIRLDAALAEVLVWRNVSCVPYPCT